MSTTRVRGWLTRPLSTRATWIGFAVAALIAALVILRAYRGLTFFYDEWDFIQDRRGWGLDSFLLPHNEHFVALPAFIFKIWFVIFGLGSYWPYAALSVICHIACAGALLTLIRRWSSNEAALAAAIAILFMGSAFEILLWPFEIEVTLCLALGLWALLALLRRTRRGDVMACLLLVLAVASSSLGIPLVVGALVLILMQRLDWRRLWIVAVPVVIYAIWYLKYGHSTAQLANIRYIPEYSARQASSSLHAIFGLPLEYGPPLALALLILVGVALGRRWGDRQGIVPIVAVLVVMWAFLTLSRYGISPPDSSRYLYATAALMLIIGLAILGRTPLNSITARAVIVVLLAISLTTNLGSLREGGQGWRGAGDEVRASIGALNQVRALAPADFNPQGHWAPQLKAAKLFAAEDAIGSPAYSSDEIVRASNAARADADAVLLGVGALTIQSGNPPTAACTSVRGTTGEEREAVAVVPPHGLVVHAATANAAIRVARYSVLGPGDARATAVPGGPGQVITPTIPLGPPAWKVQVRTTGTATICKVR